MIVKHLAIIVFSTFTLLNLCKGQPLSYSMHLTFSVNKSIDQVFSCLTDMNKFAALHPIISKIDPLNTNHYMAYETLKLGPIPFSFRYPVTLEKNDQDKTILMKAVVFKFTRISLNFKLAKTAAGTRVDEQIDFKTIFLLKPLLRAILKKQHTQLFKTMNS